MSLHLLPPEIITIILLHLPVQDFLRLTQTCRSLFQFRWDSHVWARLAHQKFEFPVNLFESNNYTVQRSSCQNDPLQRYYQVWMDHLNLDVALIQAAEKGDLALIQYYLPKAESIYWAILEACEHGHIEVIQYLISHWKNSKGSQVLNDFMARAGKCGQLELVKYFVSQGANYWSGTMSRAAKRGHRNVVAYCLCHEASDLNRSLIAASMGGHQDIIELLLTAGATHLDEAMANAAGEGHLDLVKFFLERGATQLNWAMESAARSGHRRIVFYLFSQGAFEMDLNTTLILGVMGGDLEIVRTLVERGATDIETALTVANYRQHSNIVEYLQSMRD